MQDAAAVTDGEFRRRYAEAVRLERIRANLTQPEFAQLVGVSLGTVQQWEYAIKLPSAIVRRRLGAMYPRLRDVLGNGENDERGTDDGEA
jgi:transcriptional regulator with XRE-family HTH domain